VLVSSWDEYISKLDGKPPARGMPTFHARFKLAVAFESFSAAGIAMNSIKTYSALCKLGMSYASLDHLERTLRIKEHPKIHALDLANCVRETWPKGFETISRKMDVNHLLLEKIEGLFGDTSCSDVRPIIEVLRHAIFHGSFTPSGWKMKSQKTLELIDGLSQVTLRKADQTFTSWFKEQKD